MYLLNIFSSNLFEFFLFFVAAIRFLIISSFTSSTVRLLFYGLENEKNIKVKVGDNTNEILINNFEFINLGFNSDNCQNVILEVDSSKYDITEIIKKVKYNTIR